jgi:hypothetical protein
MSFYYLEEDYVWQMFLNQVTDGLHPLVDDNVLTAPDVVGHEFDLPLAILDYKNVDKIHSSTDNCRKLRKQKIPQLQSKDQTNQHSVYKQSKYSGQEQMQDDRSYLEYTIFPW